MWKHTIVEYSGTLGCVLSPFYDSGHNLIWTRAASLFSTEINGKLINPFPRGENKKKSITYITTKWTLNGNNIGYLHYKGSR